MALKRKKKKNPTAAGQIPGPMQWVKGACVATPEAQLEAAAWIPSLVQELDVPSRMLP